MSESALIDQSLDRQSDDLGDEVRALRDHFAERDGQQHDQDQSPQAFYARSLERPDVREILRRLADG